MICTTLTKTNTTAHNTTAPEQDGLYKQIDYD